MSSRTLMRNLEDFENPRIVELSADLYGASFFLMKLLPARFMLERAVEQGQLKPGFTICESSSGTFGLALAMLAVQYGYKFTLVSDWAIDRHLHRRLAELGTHVEIVQTPAPSGGLQQARLNRLAEYLREIPDSFWPSQYSNPDNQLAYGKFAELLIKKIGKVDCLVGPVGSGGSMCGTTKFLRPLFPELRAIGVDTPNSVLFGQPGGKPIELRGLGGAIVPSNLDHTQFDEVHWLTAAEAFHGANLLHKEHGLFMGPTSGAAYRVADWWSRKNPGKKVVAIFPDEGHRYVETVYNKDWLSTAPGGAAAMRPEPVVVEAPTEELKGWSTYAWHRRTRDQVLSSLVDKASNRVISPPARLTTPLSFECDSEPQHNTTMSTNEPCRVTLTALSHFDDASLAHLELAPEQAQFVEPLHTVFLGLQSSDNSELKHPFGIVVQDEIVGFFVLREKSALPEWAPPDVITLHSFRIGRSYQGNGYGKAATELISKWVASNRPYISRVMLAVNRKNLIARHIYVSCGFRETGATYCGPAGPQDILQYKLDTMRAVEAKPVE
ncbi:pyridoxal-phosphate dependent enzyme [Paraburkholderia sp. BL9I2N2]|uniref:pyridoxal-phosphate dependent enzyme n=1 Tax=Paraburkholderia sp. BL9I2N2 TaxID=1938809 RepID=UPI001044DF00|nr:pyridoxal-phosphate dependent enzyme [Paraburkholderia sp. BL9I2N2]TCK94635.1 cysteine synthase A [Paraburkholderia sp. BL9I2N2]